MENKLKVLLVTYFFSPIGTPRSFRWINLTRELSESDCSFDVLTVEPSVHHENYDATLEEKIHKQVRIIRTYPGPMHVRQYRNPTGAGLPNMNSRFKGKNTMKFFLIPDSHVEWIPWGYKVGKRLLLDNDYDLIISSGYPFSSHLLAFFLKNKSGVKWLADYGDPWSFNPDPQIVPMSRRRLDRIIERFILRDCDGAIVTTPETKVGFLEHFSVLDRGQVDVVPQGYDQERLEEIEPERGNRFRLVYTGVFYDKIREPFQFYEALRLLMHLDIEVVIVGNISDRHRTKSEAVKYLGHQTHDRALSLQKGADVLLFFGNSSSYQLPGKIFEYFAARRPILSIKYAERDLAADLIQKHHRGACVMNDFAKIADELKKLHCAWREMRLDSAYNLEAIDTFSWKAVSRNLRSVIMKVAG
jgi:hypothetical protein